MPLPEPEESRSRTKWQEAPGLGEGTHTQRRAGPSSPGQNTASPFPPGSGAPDRLGSSPTLQLERANCSHCPEGTNEAPGSVLAQSAFGSLHPDQLGMEVPFPTPGAKASCACATTVASDARKRGQGSGMPEGRCPDVLDLPDRLPTLLRPLKSCGATAGLEGGDTHRPKLPVWASCRMRCSCLFIILGTGWGRRGVTVGVEAGSPRPSLLPRALRPGWVGGALASWAAALF